MLYDDMYSHDKGSKVLVWNLFTWWEPTTMYMPMGKNNPYYYACIKTTRGVTHCDLAIYIKTYLKAKEEYLHSKIFHHAKI
jgi:hypothetical protein